MNVCLLDRIVCDAADSDPVWRFPAEQTELCLSTLIGRADVLAAALYGEGIERGDRVVILMETGSAAVTALLALWRIGAVAVPLRPSGTDDTRPGGFLARVAVLCSAQLVLCAQESAADPGWGPRRLDPVKLLQRVAVAGASASAPRVGAPLTDLALIQFTSGSTGNPKGVRVSQAMVLTQLRRLCENYALGTPGVRPRSIGSWLPIYHDMGLFIGMLLPLFCGADALLAPPLYFIRNPARWYRHLSDTRCDLTFATSSVLAATLRGTRHLSVETCDLSCLVMYLAAEKISPVVLDRLDAALGPFGLSAKQVRTGYGLAEYTLGCASSGHGPVCRRHVRISGSDVSEAVPGCGGSEFVSVGSADTGAAIVIRDDAGNALGDWQLGQITVAGPCMMDGYENNPRATSRMLGHGYLETGDLGFQVDGELFVSGRLDDMMIVGGRNIVPPDVELDVEDLDFVGPGRALLFAIDDPDTGEAGQVLLIETPLDWHAEVKSARFAKIRRMILEKYGFAPSQIALVPRRSIEKTSSGKKRTKVLRQRWIDGTLARFARPEKHREFA